MAELNFLEYNINPTETLVDNVTICLKALGFNKISVTKNVPCPCGHPINVSF